MRISHCGHAAVLVETDRSRTLIDPGNLSGGWHGLTDLDAILITHVHPDHLDPEHLPALMAANPSATIYAETSIPRLLAAGDVDVSTMTPLSAGDELALGTTTVSVVGGVHAEIHRDIPRIGNVGYVLRTEGEPTFFHPGDSYDIAPAAVDVLAMPAYGPWAALKETIDFVREVQATEAFPIHEQLLSDRGVGLVTTRIGEMTTTRVVDLRSGDAHTF